MQSQDRFLGRVDYQGDFKELMKRVARDYQVGEYQSHEIVPFGYEDLNVKLTTNQGDYFAKIFASSRPAEQPRALVQRILKAIEAGVSHSSLYTTDKDFLHTISGYNRTVALCLMDFIDNGSVFNQDNKLTSWEESYLIEQATRVNKMEYQPTLIYDSWAIPNFLDEYQKKKVALQSEDVIVVGRAASEFARLNINQLPKAFVHGDIITTNVLRSSAGKLYIIDFAVSNWYPRVTELAVLVCGLLFKPDSFALFYNSYTKAITEYQKHLLLTKKEVDVLPTFIRAGFAMYVLSANYERATGNTEAENNHLYETGRKSLVLSSKLTN